MKILPVVVSLYSDLKAFPFNMSYFKKLFSFLIAGSLNKFESNCNLGFDFDGTAK